MRTAADVYKEIKNSVILWEKTVLSKYVFSTPYEDDEILLQLNDFPDQPLCSLIVDDSLLNLEEMPVGWSLPAHREEEI